MASRYGMSEYGPIASNHFFGNVALGHHVRVW